jgi:hypothetical protein
MGFGRNLYFERGARGFVAHGGSEKVRDTIVALDHVSDGHVSLLGLNRYRVRNRGAVQDRRERADLRVDCRDGREHLRVIQKSGFALSGLELMNEVDDPP